MQLTFKNLSTRRHTLGLFSFIIKVISEIPEFHHLILGIERLFCKLINSFLITNIFVTVLKTEVSIIKTLKTADISR